MLPPAALATAAAARHSTGIPLLPIVVYSVSQHVWMRGWMRRACKQDRIPGGRQQSQVGRQVEGVVSNTDC